MSRPNRVIIFWALIASILIKIDDQIKDALIWSLIFGIFLESYLFYKKPDEA